MSTTRKTLGDRGASAAMQLHLFMEGEIKLTEAQFEAHWDTLTELLEDANNHRYRFGRTIPASA